MQAILSQEVGWFDIQGAGEMGTRVADLIGRVQDGLGRKAADLIQNLAQVLLAPIVIILKAINLNCSCSV